MKYFPEYAISGSSLVAATDDGTLASTWVDMSNKVFVDFIINTTDANADTTVDAVVQSADDSSGTNAANITGLALTQDTAAATAQQYILRVRHDQLNGDDSHVGCTVTAGDGTSGVVTSIVALGFWHDYAPDADSDAATVIEIVNI